MGDNTLSIAHIDMDFIVYAVASACEGKWWKYKGQVWDSKVDLNRVLKRDGVDDSAVESGSNPEPWHKVKDSIVSYTEDIISEVDADYKGYLSGKGNFRYKVATILPYKGNRKDFVKPYHYDGVRQFLTEHYDASLSRGEEADDAIGQAHNPETDIIVSRDKDLDLIPGEHFDWVKNKKYYVDVVDANRNFYKQLCVGDTSDNILGLYNVGPKSTMCKAIGTMDREEDMFNRVYEEYASRFGSYADMFLEENAKLLWIRQNRRTFIHEYFEW